MNNIKCYALYKDNGDHKGDRKGGTGGGWEGDFPTGSNMEGGRFHAIMKLDDMTTYDVSLLGGEEGGEKDREVVVIKAFVKEGDRIVMESEAASVPFRPLLISPPPPTVPTLIIDTFTYLPTNSSLLRLRLHELYPVVDAFIIILGTHTHSGQPLNREWDNHEWWGYGDKVTVVRVDLHHTLNIDGDEGGLVREMAQRDATTDAVLDYVNSYNANVDGNVDAHVEYENVLVLGGDSDEFPSRRKVADVRWLLMGEGGGCKAVQMLMKWHLYSFNWLVQDGVWGYVAKESAYATTLSNLLTTTPTTLRRWMRDPSYPSSSLPCILPDSGWHLSSFGSAADLVYKVKSTCCEHTKYEGFEVYGSEESMGRMARGGTAYFQISGSDDGKLEVSRYEGEYGGHPLAVRECEGKGVEGCEWMSEFFTEELSEEEKYAMDQDVIYAWHLKGDFAVDYTTSSHEEGLYAVEVDCERGGEGDRGAVGVSEIEVFGRSQAGGITGESKVKLVERVKTLCEEGGWRGKVVEKVWIDDNVYQEIDYDGKSYIIRLRKKDDPGEVARYHCKGIGLNEEQCAVLEEEMKTWF